MARKYLGPTIDIHGGGIDNIYPHNENEIAQSEAANHAEFARYWMLVGSLTVEGVKMSKSLGNFTTIRDALARHRPQAIRLFSLSAHYASPVDYSEAALSGAAGGWERLESAWRRAQRRMARLPDGDGGGADGGGFLPRIEQARAQFAAAMNDDFNTPQAIAALQQFTRDVNALLQGGAALGSEILGQIVATYQELAGEILGLQPATERADAARETALIELLLELRAGARAERQYATSDHIRDELARLGIALEDGADGTSWRST